MGGRQEDPPTLGHDPRAVLRPPGHRRAAGVAVPRRRGRDPRVAWQGLALLADVPSCLGSDMSVVEALLASEEPSVRWKVRTRVLGESADAADIRQLREEIRTSPRVRTLLDGDPEGKRGTYDKWHGRHWVL